MRKIVFVIILMIAFSSVVACSSGSTLNGQWTSGDEWLIFKEAEVSLYHASQNKGEIGSLNQQTRWGKDANTGKISIIDSTVPGGNTPLLVCTLTMPDELDCGKKFKRFK
jgi:hypothetical protein